MNVPKRVLLTPGSLSLPSSNLKPNQDDRWTETGSSQMNPGPMFPGGSDLGLGFIHFSKPTGFWCGCLLRFCSTGLLTPPCTKGKDGLLQGAFGSGLLVICIFLAVDCPCHHCSVGWMRLLQVTADQAQVIP